MKLTFTPPRDQAVHRYCLRCGAEALRLLRAIESDFVCLKCGYQSLRALIIDPQVNWWLDDDNEYWHEVAGVFVRNERGEYLFFERLRHPLGLTIPAGHVDTNEDAFAAALRELREETSLRLSRLRLVTSEAILGDSCRRGADAHYWHCFVGDLPSGQIVTLASTEGVRPLWLRLEDALQRNLTYATRYLITRHIQSIYGN